ncbi:diguanylate cyclase (GGDEF)-like protein [Deinococcus metalli]|uniref:Diguanylate cyclase (GGDEF)-like protein n=1 Tax=Deinococcus metalli TaxID=1141878 RepID=A0A7W8NNW9_9DEIO|nr:bifunctional diguanylate cyclase/phosphodiesterase [Deinococcus metalli]MBB5376206.1 diguanylate cyclase (GGDEF)-like protein [Deinococcus metalli]GHF39993.1 hypothetical protein GCM10017781_15760 [Deinococcus metalli]
MQMPGGAASLDGGPETTHHPAVWSPGRRAVTAALMVTVLLLALFAVLSGVQTRTLTHAAGRSARQSDLYQKVRYWVGAEESLERKYRLEPSAAILAQHAKAADNVRMVLSAARNNSGPDEQARINALLSLHAEYVTTVNTALFPAVRTHDTAHVNNIDRIVSDPAFTRLEQRVDAEARVHRRASSAQFARLTRLQDTLAVLAPLVFLGGVGALLSLWRVLQRHQRLTDAANEATMTRLRAEAITDPLTALGNHRAFQEGLGAALRLGALDHTPLTVARLDVDEFKVINDRGGHLHGDRVLASVGRVLSGAFPGRAYRVGGDEFALLLPLPAEPAAAAIDDVRTRLATAHLPTVSAGLTTRAGAGAHPDDVQQQAEEALREAKRRGRDRLVTFQDVAGRASLLGQEQVDALRDLLHHGRVDVVFQPIWGPPTPERAASVPLAFEALARPAAASGFREPQELFDVAARVNRGAELDRLCVQAALAHAQALPDGALLFLNVSAPSLDQDTPLAPELLREVGAAGLPPHRVVIEITERSVGNLAAVTQQAAGLRAAGFRVALDDVGAGNSGLQLLRCLTVDYVKIDHSVVANAPTDPTANAVLAALMAYAREAGVSVIVEGIETVPILTHAWRLGARCTQGYLLGRPAPGFHAALPAELARVGVVGHPETTGTVAHARP